MKLKLVAEEILKLLDDRQVNFTQIYIAYKLMVELENRFINISNNEFDTLVNSIYEQYLTIDEPDSFDQLLHELLENIK